MILKITDSRESFGMDVCTMTLEEFSRKEVHPYIATERWEHIEVDLCDSTPAGYLNQMIYKCPVIPVILGEVTPKVLMRLCEMYPSERAYLRMNYNKGKEDFQKFLQEISEKYNWSLLSKRR